MSAGIRRLGIAEGDSRPVDRHCTVHPDSAHNRDAEPSTVTTYAGAVALADFLATLATECGHAIQCFHGFNFEQHAKTHT